MQLIIGHTTYESASIWVRGGPKDQRLQVELELLERKNADQEHPDPDPEQLELDESRDYTEVAKFKSGLIAGRRYKVLVRSLASGDKLLGQLRTFPERGSSDAFHFLHGSCHISTARLTAIGSMAVGLVGRAATTNALTLPFSDWELDDLHPCLGWLKRQWARKQALRALTLASYLPHWVMKRTRFEQPNAQLLPSPFGQIFTQSVAGKEALGARPAFMIHCGDQIYFDVDIPQRKGKKEDYRRNYRQAWFADKGAATLLTSLPHYMILDDHEVLDGFGTDPDDRAERLSKNALAVYDEYVAARQPPPPQGDGLYYTFEHGDCGFFVLDTRTERRSGRADELQSPQMIGDKQLADLENWLREDRFELKFIVSSVPFVAEVRPPGLNANGERRPDERSDKWSGEEWRTQRERIIATIHDTVTNPDTAGNHDVGLGRIVFLVGDMHCTYHATMQIGSPSRRITIHELAGGPINQLDFAKRDQFYARYVGEFAPLYPEDSKETLPWVSTLQAFHGAAPSVLEVSVPKRSANEPPRVDWKALRTHKARAPGPSEPASHHDPHHLCGSIRFPRQPKKKKGNE